jgi:hypothetical protein
MVSSLVLVATVPLAPAAYLLLQRIRFGFPEWSQQASLSLLWHNLGDHSQQHKSLTNATITSQLLAYLLLSIIGHFATLYLIPKIKVRYQSFPQNIHFCRFGNVISLSYRYTLFEEGFQAKTWVKKERVSLIKTCRLYHRLDFLKKIQEQEGFSIFLNP